MGGNKISPILLIDHYPDAYINMASHGKIARNSASSRASRPVLRRIAQKSARRIAPEISGGNIPSK